MAIGSVGVGIVPDADGFWREFEAKTRGGADNAGRSLGQGIGQAASARIAEVLQAALRGLPVANQGKQAGQKYGDEFGRAVTTRINAAMRSIGKVKVDADTAPAERELQKLRVEIGRLGSGINVGRLNDKQALAQISDLQRRLAKVAKKSPTAKVRVDTAEAIAQLAALQAQIKGIDGALGNASQRTSDWGASFKPIIDSALLLGPALLPIAGAATGVGAAFVGMGGAGVAAFLGIKSAMKSGSELGHQYSGLIDGVQSKLEGLEATAARHVLAPFAAGVQTLNQRMPFLNQEVGGLSEKAADAAQHGLSAILGMFQNLSPLVNNLAQYLDDGARALDKWANNGGLEGFGAYAQSVLPGVAQTLSSVAQAAGHIVQGIGPLGGASLAILKGIADAVRSIPIPVITGLATAFITLRTAAIGLRVLSVAARGLTSIGTAASRVGRTIGLSGGAGVAAGFGIMGAAAGIAGVALFGLTKIMSENAQQAQRLAADQQAYVRALQDSNGAITQAVTQQVLQVAAGDKTLSTLKKLGISTTTWTDAVENGGTAYKMLSAQLLHTTGSGALLLHNLAQQRQQFKEAQEQVKNYTDANTANNLALAKANPALAVQAQTLGGTVTAFQAAQAAAKKDAASNASNTLQMQIEGDTAGLLQQALEGLAGKALSVGEAQTHFGQAVNAATAALKQNGNTVDVNTTKGEANRQAIEQMASSNRSLVQAQLNSVKSSGQANAIIDKANATFKTNAARIYGAKSAAFAYAVQVGLIPHVAATDPKFNAGPATSALGIWRANIKNLPKSETLHVYADTSKAETSIEQLVNTPRTAYVQVQQVIHGRASGGRAFIEADGGILDGFVSKYADGGITSDQLKAGISKFAEGHVAQIAPAGAMRLWAEPETGGEAYIPLAASKRSRSLAIWEETGKRLNAYADGGINAGPPLGGVPLVGELIVNEVSQDPKATANTVVRHLQMLGAV